MCEIVSGPVSAEVIAQDSKLMIQEGLALHKISDNIVVKLPCTIEGIKACKYFADEGIMTNLTLCFSPTQALIAAKAGATFVSPFIGRLDDIAQDGLMLIDEIVSIFSNYDTIITEILVASVRNPGHVIESAKMGADIATLPPKLLRQMVQHPLTDKGLEIFLSDWEKSGQKIII
jgi:transaldolase